MHEIYLNFFIGCHNNSIQFTGILDNVYFMSQMESIAYPFLHHSECLLVIMTDAVENKPCILTVWQYKTTFYVCLIASGQNGSNSKRSYIGKVFK